MMRCLFCQKGPAEGVSVLRVNATGRPGVWACQKHIGQTDASVGVEVLAILDAMRPKGRS